MKKAKPDFDDKAYKIDEEKLRDQFEEKVRAAFTKLQSNEQFREYFEKNDLDDQVRSKVDFYFPKLVKDVKADKNTFAKAVGKWQQQRSLKNSDLQAIAEDHATLMKNFYTQRLANKEDTGESLSSQLYKIAENLYMGIARDTTLDYLSIAENANSNDFQKFSDEIRELGKIVISSKPDNTINQENSLRVDVVQTQLYAQTSRMRVGKILTAIDEEKIQALQNFNKLIKQYTTETNHDLLNDQKFIQDAQKALVEKLNTIPSNIFTDLAQEHQSKGKAKNPTKRFGKIINDMLDRVDKKVVNAKKNLPDTLKSLEEHPTDLEINKTFLKDQLITLATADPIREITKTISKKRLGRMFRYAKTQKSAKVEIKQSSAKPLRWTQSVDVKAKVKAEEDKKASIELKQGEGKTL